MQGCAFSPDSFYKFQGAFANAARTGGQERAQDQSRRQQPSPAGSERHALPSRPFRQQPHGEGQQIDASPEGPAVVPVSHGRSRPGGAPEPAPSKIR